MVDVNIADVQVPDSRLRALGDYQRLVLSIKEVGLLQPITVTEDLVLVAGRHRLEACKHLGMKKIQASIVALDELHRELAEIDENIVRNELTALERADHLKRRKEIYEALHPQTRNGAQGGGRNGVGTRTRTESEIVSFSVDTAAKSKLSERTIQHDVQIAADIPQQAKEALSKTPVANRKTDLLKIARMEDEKERDAVVEKISAGAKSVKEAKKAIQAEKLATIPASITKATDRFRVLHGNLAVVGAEIQDASVDVIITDPPYPREYLPVYSDLAILAARILKPGGSCVVMIGQSYLPEILQRICEHLTYRWIVSYQTPGGQAVQVWDRKVNTFWKPLLWFTKGARGDDRWIGDVTKSKTNDNDKRFHHWGQSESGMLDIVDRFSMPGDTVVDPFCGAGTTGVVSVSTGRKFIGIDIDEQHVRTSSARLAQAAAVQS